MAKDKETKKIRKIDMEDRPNRAKMQASPMKEVK